MRLCMCKYAKTGPAWAVKLIQSDPILHACKAGNRKQEAGKEPAIQEDGVNASN